MLGEALRVKKSMKRCGGQRSGNSAVCGQRSSAKSRQSSAGVLNIVILCAYGLSRLAISYNPSLHISRSKSKFHCGTTTVILSPFFRV